MSGGTIFALATAPGTAGIAVIRISGPEAGRALRVLSGRDLPEPRHAARVRLHSPAAADSHGEALSPGAHLDDGLALWFPGPASYTGEDVVELHIHGGKATVDAVSAALGTLDALRLAEPGEFTRRAFQNGKLDLTRVEALADLIAAETEAQRHQALAQLSGVLAERYDGWRERLIGLLAHAEAAIDFAEEVEPEVLLDQVLPNILLVYEEITQHLVDKNRGERLRTGYTIAILGAPNVGKSSLLNLLAGRDAAIVSDSAGTTRDVIEVHMDLGGLPVTLADTAGLREGGDAIEAEGIRRARTRADQADLTLAVFDATFWPATDPATRTAIGRQSIVALNKTDLAAGMSTVPFEADIGGTSCLVHPVSARTGAGMEALLEMLAACLRDLFQPGGPAPLTRERHRAALQETADALARIDETLPPELLAEELRLAVRALGRITGRVDVEEVLDRVFAEFCIGK